MVRTRTRGRNKTDRRPIRIASTAGKRTGAPARRHGALVIAILGALVFVNLYVFVWDKKTSVGAIKDQAAHAAPAMTVASQPLETFGPPPTAPTTVVHAGAGSANGGGAPTPAPEPGVITGKVGKSDTLGRLLKKNGLAPREADEVIRALAGVLDFKSIRAGQTFHIDRGADGKVDSFELIVSKAQKVSAIRGADGVLVGKLL